MEKEKIQDTILQGYRTAGLFSGGLGVLGAYAQSGLNEKRALEEQQKAIEDLKSIDYIDYNREYYNQLVQRANLGLYEPQRQYMEDQADRAAQIGLQQTEDRGAGLIGIGRAQTSLADAYRNIAMQDIQAREANKQMQLAELANRGMQTYQEEAGAANIDLSLARQNRQEEIQKRQAMTQNLIQVGSIGADLATAGLG
jgi:hypothetical protein